MLFSERKRAKGGRLKRDRVRGTKRTWRACPHQVRRSSHLCSRDNRLFPTFLHHAKLVSGPIYSRPVYPRRIPGTKSRLRKRHVIIANRAAQSGGMGGRGRGKERGQAHLHFCNKQTSVPEGSLGAPSSISIILS